MPCSTDPPTNREVATARTRELVNEIEGRDFDHKDFHASYCGTSDLQANVRKLCVWCKKNSNKVGSMSLELQLWWRDHQAEDTRHEKEALVKQQKRAIRRKALSKLSSEERRALDLYD